MMSFSGKIEGGTAICCSRSLPLNTLSCIGENMSKSNLPYRRPFRPCTVPGCAKGVNAKGLCSTHANRLKTHGDLNRERWKPPATCQVSGCDKPHCSRGYCVAHWSRFHKYGDPLALAPPRYSQGARALRHKLDSMRQRCTNPNVPQYKYYGGRGIECRFKSAEELFTALGPRPSPAHSIDRIDNDGHYEAGNVRWATQTEQMQNSRQIHNLTLNGVTRSMREWAEVGTISYRTLSTRVNRGWCDECALTNPVATGGRGGCTHRYAKELKDLIR